MCNDELWVGGHDEGIIVYNLDLEQIKHIEHPQFEDVTCVLKTPTGMIVCDSDTGVHHLNHQGDYTNLISSSRFSDTCLPSNDKIYALNYEQGEIHTFVRKHDSWVKNTQFKLPHYSDGGFDDKLCTTSTHLYVSSCNLHRILVYTLSGGYANTVNVHSPYLSDVDSEGKILVCHLHNHKVQVFDTKHRVWSELCGLEGVKWPNCAVMGGKHLWVVTMGQNFFPRNQLLKFEAI